jgi:hypothetical protein
LRLGLQDFGGIGWNGKKRDAQRGTWNIQIVCRSMAKGCLPRFLWRSGGTTKQAAAYSEDEAKEQVAVHGMVRRVLGMGAPGAFTIYEIHAQKSFSLREATQSGKTFLNVNPGWRLLHKLTRGYLLLPLRGSQSAPIYIGDHETRCELVLALSMDGGVSRNGTCLRRHEVRRDGRQLDL